MSAKDILLHAAELEERSEYAPALSDFLTVSEQAALCHLVRDRERLFFWGGFSGAERRCAVFLPEWAVEGAPRHTRFDSPEREEFFRRLLREGTADVSEDISLLDIRGSGHREISHRDVLGSLMGLGITRQKVGDICMTSAESAVIAVSGKLVPFLLENLTSVGRDSITATPVEEALSFTFERKFEEIFVTVASMRLDCIVSAVTGMSRTGAAESITAGLVQVTGEVKESVSATVSEGDTVTVRGYGKYLIFEDGGLSKKGRIRLTVKKYA